MFTLRCIRQTKNNRDELWSETIGAISDILVQDWADRAGEVLDAFDHIPLGVLRGRSRCTASLAGAHLPWNAYLQVPRNPS